MAAGDVKKSLSFWRMRSARLRRLQAAARQSAVGGGASRRREYDSFIARYRKERTGGLDETALRAIDDGISNFRELAERKTTILKAIAEQGKLDDPLREKIVTCRDKKEFEEIYLPYKPKRRTRATIARQRGLEPLAVFLKRQVNTGVGARGNSAALRPSRAGCAGCRNGPRRGVWTSSPSSGPTTGGSRRGP